MKLMLDNFTYTTKPKDFGLINARIIKNAVDIDIIELAQEVIKGKTFTPAYFKGKNGEIHRRKEYWHSLEVIALDFDEGMTIDEALDEFAASACFLYTTFSHTDAKHKFRVVFVLDRPIYKMNEFERIINALLTKYPQADRHCKDCNRLFFGGKKLYELDFNNRISVDDFLSSSSFDRTYKNLGIYPAKNPKQLKSSKYQGHNELANNLQLIQQRDIEELQKRIDTEANVLHSKFEVSNFLKRQDLREYLGITTNGNFIDIFHDEINPSASIYVSYKGNGHQMYKCHSTSSEFTGTILEITERLLDSSRLDSINFLMELYQVEVYESEQQKALKDELDMYKELLQSEDLEEMYPNFYKVFNRYGYLKDMYILLDLVKEYLPAGDDKRLLFYQSLDTISKQFGKSKSVTHTRMNFLTFFEFLSKLDKNQIPKELYELQLESKRKKGHRYLNSTYEIHLYSQDFFNTLDKKCASWIEKGCTTQTVNYEGILRNFGRSEANRVFPQDQGKEISDLNEDVSLMIRNTTLELIESEGWTTEQDVLDNVTLYFKGQKKFKQKQFKICLGEIIEDYDLERIRLNKDLKDEMCIGGKGYGYILRRKEYIFDVPAIELKNQEHGIFA